MIAAVISHLSKMATDAGLLPAEVKKRKPFTSYLTRISNAVDGMMMPMHTERLETVLVRLKEETDVSVSGGGARAIGRLRAILNRDPRFKIYEDDGEWWVQLVRTGT
jgi:hypothetical protein